jgi:hypothetical protein
MRRWPVYLATLAVAVLTGFAGRAGAVPFANWAAVVVAGDYHAAHTNEPTETFDNARRDIAAELIRKGFRAENLRQFSVRPELYHDAKLAKSDQEPISEALKDLAAKDKGGCLVYFTSHGSQEGVIVDGAPLPPPTLDQMVTDACGTRPTIIVISACFSGVFVPQLEETHRMILTAAAADRTSFGCGATDKYPYFDACMLQVLPQAHNFAELGPEVQACVAERETETGAAPPSDPQLYVGPTLRFDLPLMSFAPG